MGLNWPPIQSINSDMSEQDMTAVRGVLDDFGSAAEVAIQRAGFPTHASPLWQPWNVAIVRDSEKVVAAFSLLQGGTAAVRWLDRPTDIFPPDALAASMQNELSMTVRALVVLPRPEGTHREASVAAAVTAHVAEVERAQTLGRLGDISKVRHLEPHLREFLSAHPDPQRSVFVMMRFMQSDQLDATYKAIRDTLAARGFDAVRADDRDYTGELWSNIEVYMTCSMYGVAVFEDIDKRDFNPNVSLELGYMLANRRRCLILKEQRLPDLPADVVHRLYKPFDMFDIERSVSREVARWVDVDLGITGNA